MSTVILRLFQGNVAFGATRSTMGLLELQETMFFDDVQKLQDLLNIIKKEKENDGQKETEEENDKKNEDTLPFSSILSLESTESEGEFVERYLKRLSMDDTPETEIEAVVKVLNRFCTSSNEMLSERAIHAMIIRGALGLLISLLPKLTSMQSETTMSLIQTLTLCATRRNEVFEIETKEEKEDNEEDKEQRKIPVSVQSWSKLLSIPCGRGQYASYSPLHVAIHVGNDDVVKMLLAAKVDTTVRLLLSLSLSLSHTHTHTSPGSQSPRSHELHVCHCNQQHRLSANPSEGSFKLKT